MKGQHGRRWTTEQLMRLTAMWLRGDDVAAIAAEFGTTTFAINKTIGLMRADGIPMPRRKQGHVAGRKNKPWTQSEVEYVVRRRAEHATAEQIATELDRSFYGVQGLICKLRQENVPVPMLGNGKRRLWDSSAINISIVGRGLTLARAGNDEQIEEFKRALS
jgi:hypothetical protein